MKTSLLFSNLWLLLTALALLPAHVLAQPATIDEAEQHYTRGLAAAQENDYQRALDEFQASYQLRQVPRLLINIGTAHFRLGNARKALAVFDAYLKVEPNAPPDIRKKVQDLSEQCRAALAAQEMLASQQSPPANNFQRSPVSTSSESGRPNTAPVGSATPPAKDMLLAPRTPGPPEQFSRRSSATILGLSWSMFAAASVTTVLLISLNHTSVGMVSDKVNQLEAVNILTPAYQAAGFLSAVSLAVAIPITIVIKRSASTNRRPISSHTSPGLQPGKASKTLPNTQ